MSQQFSPRDPIIRASPANPSCIKDDLIADGGPFRDLDPPRASCDDGMRDIAAMLETGGFCEVSTPLPPIRDRARLRRLIHAALPPPEITTRRRDGQHHRGDQT
jgi:hypothetical protein